VFGCGLHQVGKLMRIEWRFVFVKPSQWCVTPRYSSRGQQFQFQWLFFYLHRIIIQ
jgi:hypothetical protein